MSNNNNPPFHVGQRVVCVDTLNWPKDWIGQIGVVTYYETLSCGCGIIQVTGFDLCGVECDLHQTPTIEKGGNPIMFAPIEPRHQDVKIVEELLRQPVEERLDAPVGNPIKIVKEDTVKINTSKIVLP